MWNETYIMATNTTGSTNARKVVVALARTNVMSRFLTINVQTCLKKGMMVASRSERSEEEDSLPVSCL